MSANQELAERKRQNFEADTIALALLNTDRTPLEKVIEAMKVIQRVKGG